MGDALHNWIARHKPGGKTGVCSRCGEERYTEWADVGHRREYDLDNFVELCKPCHIELDGDLERRRRQMMGNKFGLGRQHTPEDKAKISAGLKAAHARRKSSALRD